MIQITEYQLFVCKIQYSFQWVKMAPIETKLYGIPNVHVDNHKTGTRKDLGKSSIQAVLLVYNVQKPSNI